AAALALGVCGVLLVHAQQEDWDDFFNDAEAVEVRELGPEEVREVGRQLIGKMGCTGCHPSSDPELTGLRKIGPDLRRIASKTTPQWASRWIESPRDFRPTTWMPHFYPPAAGGASDAERQSQAAEVRGIVAYLWEKSEPREVAPAPEGDRGRGEQTFQTRGCTGCHIRDGDAERDSFYPEIYRLHGPNLARTGSKVTSGWLYAWLKDPKKYSPATVMPDLRLSDREAADLTAYLMADRDPVWEGLELPAVAAGAGRELAVGYLRESSTREQAEALYRAMSEGERDAYLGEQSIRRRGCYGCHEIVGFEDAEPPGGALNFAAVDLGVHRDRVDVGGLRISEREAAAVTARFAEPWAGSAGAGSPGGGPTENSLALLAGHKLISRYGCRGCHLIEGEGHAIRATISDVGMLPPNLASEGSRVQDGWLRAYLRDPGTVRMRPWLTAEMPTFGFSDEEIETAVAYFHALEPEDLAPRPGAPPEVASVVAGGEVFALLQCARCHPAGAAAAAALGVAASNLAPSLEIGRERLRYEWIPLWIQDPQSWQPGTKMPTFFFSSEPGKYQSPLAGTLDTPMLAEPKQRMMEHFASEEELKAVLEDGAAVTEALRDYLWTLGE
ncbi:MAG: c-type cytochrome, partial [Thermoanaerobaculia bacterium]